MILGHDDNLISPADQAHDEHLSDLAQHDARRDRLDDFAPSPPRAEKPSRTLPVASSGDGPTVTTSSPGGRGATFNPLNAAHGALQLMLIAGASGRVPT